MRTFAGKFRSRLPVAAFFTVISALALAQTPYRQPPAAEYLKILEDPHRIDRLNPEAVVAKLGLRPGDVVADIGSGSGLFTLIMAQAVTPGGRVYAVDIDKELLAYVSAKAKESGIGNITPVLAPEDSPSLPPGSLDLALVCDTLHHIGKRQVYLKNLKACMRPGGRIAIIDFSTGWPAGHESLRFSMAELDTWTAAAGLKLTREFSDIEGNFFRVYQ